MKQNHLVVNYRHWADATQVSRDESVIIVVPSYELNGMHVSDAIGRLELAPFATFHVGLFDTSRDYEQFWLERIQEIRKDYTEADWLEETTDDLLVLPVSMMEFVEIDASVLA